MNWLSYRKWYYGLSLALLVTSLGAILAGGIRPSVEFLGGSELAIQTSSTEDIASRIEGVTEAFLQSDMHVQAGEEGQYKLSLPELTNARKDELLASLQKDVDSNISELSFQSVGPSVGRELIVKTVVAVVLALMAILVYLWSQFRDWRFGLSAVSAMLHDTFIVIGAYALFGRFFGVQADVLFVTAVLTILSFSVHDTIVLFDQVRELRRQHRTSSNEEIGNWATTQTLSRSLANSLTIILMLLALLILGGEGLRWFTATLLVGTIVGTYSSTFVALPLFVDFHRRK